MSNISKPWINLRFWGSHRTVRCLDQTRKFTILDSNINRSAVPGPHRNCKFLNHFKTFYFQNVIFCLLKTPTTGNGFERQSWLPSPQRVKFWKIIALNYCPIFCHNVVGPPINFVQGEEPQTKNIIILRTPYLNIYNIYAHIIRKVHPNWSKLHPSLRYPNFTHRVLIE